MTDKQSIKPQIKICGLTNIRETIQCAELGVDAIGFIFYPKSPRYITENKARQITDALPEKIMTIGVFVNESFDLILQKIDKCRLKAVQLHGNESPDFTKRLRDKGIFVIKALFTEAEPYISDVSKYNAQAYLIECGKGILPGGNALKWNWEKAENFGYNHPFILAGGISPDNICTAAVTASPDALDISSGVETSPGHKDISKVKKLIDNLRHTDIPMKNNNRRLRSIF